MAAKPAPVDIEPAPTTSDTTEPVDPVARATLARASDATIIEAPRTSLIRPRALNRVCTFMTFPPSERR
jgi:hypothetical protein